MKRLGSEGFTLTELLVVLVIIGVLGAIAVPNFSGEVNYYTLETAANKISTALRHAQTQAINEERDWEVVFESTAPPKVVVRPVGETGKSYELKGVSLGAMSFGGSNTNITKFDTTGNTVFGFVYLQKDTEQAKVEVNALGRVNVVTQ